MAPKENEELQKLIDKQIQGYRSMLGVQNHLNEKEAMIAATRNRLFMCKQELDERARQLDKREQELDRRGLTKEREQRVQELEQKIKDRMLERVIWFH